VFPKFLRFNGGAVARRVDITDAEGLRLMGAGGYTALPSVTRPKVLISNDDNGISGNFAWGTFGFHNTTTQRLELHADPTSALTGARNPSVALAARGTLIVEGRKTTAGVLQLGFFDTGPVNKPDVAGAKGGNVALANLLTALANLGLLTDSST
jgi:hypothetical protein